MGLCSEPSGSWQCPRAMWSGPLWDNSAGLWGIQRLAQAPSLTTCTLLPRSARLTWKGRHSTPRRTSHCARATLSPTCEGWEFSCAHTCPWPCMLLSPCPARPREPGWALGPFPCSCFFPGSSWLSSRQIQCWSGAPYGLGGLYASHLALGALGRGCCMDLLPFGHAAW